VPWVQVAATDIYYQEAGAGQPLVFLHGMSSCGEAWFQQFEAFAPYFRVIAYDSVNHGHSANSPRDQPEPDRADELEGFLQALGLDRPIVGGNSMGALTTVRWAARHPDTAAALVPSGMGIGRLGGPARLEPNARALAAAVPGAKLHVVKNSPHNVYYETAREYNQVVAQFLADLKLMPAA
jgi:pimeloyl-ACP methyl ester carboxylesterase